jgi:hypothetical protein
MSLVLIPILYSEAAHARTAQQCPAAWKRDEVDARQGGDVLQRDTWGTCSQVVLKFADPLANAEWARNFRPQASWTDMEEVS